MDAETGNVTGRWQTKMNFRDNSWDKKMQLPQTDIKTNVQIAFPTQTFTEQIFPSGESSSSNTVS